MKSYVYCGAYSSYICLKPRACKATIVKTNTTTYTPKEPVLNSIQKWLLSALGIMCKSLTGRS
ncbi:hypothetical protein [Chlamydia felis Fe/C-56]|uniref:Uncharacterized protein n=1 Tax=Chlamydia felis (strain Fe/C-56) TaxID=264202 RepID=Q254W8_CHLFF|nr:hypothetical protein [Chlamydia felis Fe/C-56]